MMFRETPDGVIAITQPSHAWISGQIIRAWGNADFGSVTPYEDVCLGAEQHDIGWLLWETAPTLNRSTGRPHSFRELTVAEHTAIWRRGTEMALALGRYPALLASLHGSGLYVGFDYAAASMTDAALAREFVEGQQAVQRLLLKSLRADPTLAIFTSDTAVERNRGLVRAADRMSIAICTAMRDMAISTDDPRQAIVTQVPTADRETDMRLTAVDGGMENIAVAPWPFGRFPVRVSCEGVVLPERRFDDVAEMREALADAKRVVLTAELISSRQ